MNEEPAARRRATAAASAALGMALALLLAGCGGSGGDPSAGSAAKPIGADQSPTAPSGSASTTPPPSRTPTSTPTPTPTPQKAKDGRDFGACLDRTCEVEVRQGDTIRFAAEFVTNTFTVDGITDSRVEFSATDDQPGTLRGYVEGTGEVETGDIHVDFEPTDDGRIILKFSPR